MDMIKLAEPVTELELVTKLDGDRNRNWTVMEPDGDRTKTEAESDQTTIEPG